MTWETVDEIPVDPAAARVYAEGWQSWSPATWYSAGARGARPEEEWQHLMRFRPGSPVSPDGLQAEGVLVVDPGTGEPARCYGAAGPDDVPTMIATLVDDCVLVRSSVPVLSTAARDGESALTTYADTFARAARVGPLAQPPTAWCSWYRYFEAVTADDVRADLAAFERHGLRVDVVQVDDGWSTGLGESSAEGLSVAPRFGSLDALLADIWTSGRRAGLWLAPFVVGAHSTLAAEHPDWVVGPAGRNWGDDLVGLDLTHPGVLDLLAMTFARLVDAGVDYLKLDFLYAGAVPGPRREEMTGTQAFRSGLALVREVVGPDVYLVGCGAPLLPSVGLVDAMRVSPDTFHEGAEDGSDGLRGLVPLAARTWQQGRWWVNDPDCVVARPSYAQRERWAAAAFRMGGLRSFSDHVEELDPWGLETVRALLADGGATTPFPDTQLRDAAEVARQAAGA